MKRGVHRWVGVERSDTLVMIPELGSFGGNEYEEALEDCRSEAGFKHPRIAPGRVVHFVDERELKLVRKACAQLEHLLSHMTVHYRGTVDLRPRLFQLLRKVVRGTLTADDLPKTWKQLDIEDRLKAIQKKERKAKR